MNQFENDGKELSELIFSKLQKSHNGFISREDILDIIDSNVNYGFKKHYFMLINILRTTLKWKNKKMV